MPGLKIAIVGAGSSYTPELVERLYLMRDAIPVRELALMDIDQRRLDIVGGFSRRFAAHLGYDVRFTQTTSLQEAIDGADFIDTQIRVGGNVARVSDERIPMRYGLIGQETTGAGGFMKAMRTIPAMLEIAREVERRAPQAWIINYTNPTGLVTEAVTKHSKARIIGLCAGGMMPRAYAALPKLGLRPESIRYDYFGLNHLNFAYNVTTDGRPLTDEEWELMAESTHMPEMDLLRKLKLLPIGYLAYFLHTRRRVAELAAQPQTRAEVILRLEEELFADYANPDQVTKPATLSKRGGGGYSELAMDVIDAIHNNRDSWSVVNVPNQGAVRFLPDDAVVEIGCLVNRTGAHPLALPEVPPSVWGLVCAVKNYEQLAVKAGVTGDRDTALLALLAHPLVGDYDVVKPLLDELLEANRSYLPQFFGGR